MTRHIAIVGAGYAGVMAVGRLRMQEPDARITLVDPGAHFQARIHLHRVAAGGDAPHVPIADLCDAWSATHRRDRLVQIDGRRLTLARSGCITPDAVVLALGSRTRVPPRTRGSAVHTLDDDASARRLAIAVRAQPGAAVTVIGGGTTAIETATALAAAHPRLRCTLWQRTPWNQRTTRLLERRFDRLGIRRLVGGPVTEVGERECVSPTHRLPHDIAVWCGGFTANRVPGLVGGHRDHRVRVDAHLRLADGVFAAGDLATPPRRHRMGCVTALPMGAHAAANVSQFLAGRPLRPFRFRDVLHCIDLAAGHGMVQSRDHVVAGRIGGLCKQAILLYVRSILALERRTGRAVYTWPQPPDEALLESA